MASTILLFPQPLGPTTALMPTGKDISCLSMNDLNPIMDSFLIFIPIPRAWWRLFRNAEPANDYQDFLADSHHIVKKKWNYDTIWCIYYGI
jgi:hypothetical protein